MADSLGTAGRLALLQGDLPKAHALLHEAVTLARALNYQRMLGESQSLLGLVTLYGGDAPEARRLLADSLRLCLDLNDGWFLGRVCTYLAETALWEGELDEAEQWLAQSLAYHADPRLIRMDQIERLLVAARLATAQGAYLRAATLFGLADEDPQPASIMSWPGRRASWPMLRWRRCARLLTRRSLPRRSRRDSSYRSRRRLPRSWRQALVRVRLFSLPQPLASSFATAAV